MNHCRQPGDESEHESLHSTQISTGDPFRPFPTDVLPKPFGDYVLQCSESIGTDPVMIAFPLLSSLSAAVGNSVVVEAREGWCEPLPIWTAVIAEPGSNKSTCISSGIKFTKERHDSLSREFRNELHVYQSEYEAWEASRNGKKKPPTSPPTKPVPRRCFVSDVTMESLIGILQANPRGVLAGYDELSGLFKSFSQYKAKSGSDVSHWLSMHRAEPISVDRKGDPFPWYVPRAFVAICGGIQPSVLRSCIAGENTENGLASRFLLTCPPERPIEWRESPVDPRIVDDCANLFRKLLNIDCREEPETLSFSPEAHELRKQFYNDHGKIRGQATGAIKSAYAKLEAAFFRIAGLFHLIDAVAGRAGGQGGISLKATEASARLLDWLRYETRRVYVGLGAADESTSLISWIAREMGGQCSARELAHKKSRYRAPGAAEAALQSLSRAGFGEWHAVDTAGRPASKLVLKPEYLQASNGSL